MQVERSTEGSNFGACELLNNEVVLSSNKSSKRILNVKLENFALCVVPANNRDEIEIQFVEPEKHDRHEDGLVQMTLHFPTGEDEEGLTNAEVFQKSILNTGVIRSVTGNIITEFSKEQGNFVTPRGKYAMQMTSTYVHMQGAQYAYKIKYDDINSLFLLPKMDGGRMAFVISLEKPIRQGNQKYQNLVLETHKLDHTLTINLTQEEIDSKYEGQLSPQMTMPMSSLIAKVFKVLSQKKVFIPKQFISARDAHCIRCSIKANDGLLYPLAKSFIFINKPCIIITFESIEYVEFKRYEPAANSATRNFDLVINVKEGSNAENVKEFAFMSIDRSEYASLFDYLNVKEIKIKNPQEAGPAHMAKNALMDELGGEGEDSDEGSEEDGDYNSGSETSKSGDSDDSGTDESEGEAEKPEKKRKKDKTEKVKKEPSSKKRRSEEDGEPKKKAAPKAKKAAKGSDDEGDDDEGGAGKKKKEKRKKDKDAPKAALSAYILFSKEERPRLLIENPSMPAKEILKECGARWKLLSSEEKKPFEDLAKIDKERYNQAMIEYKNKKLAEGGDADDADGDEENEGEEAPEDDDEAGILG